jgi:hypothetical protein
MRALLVVLACACRSGEVDAPCATAAGRYFTIVKGELDKATVDDVTRHAVEDRLPAMSESLERACREGGWSPRVRNCLANAPDHAAYDACHQQLTETQRSALDRATRAR